MLNCFAGKQAHESGRVRSKNLLNLSLVAVSTGVGHRQLQRNHQVASYQLENHSNEERTGRWLEQATICEDNSQRETVLLTDSSNCCG